jgi:hypothetical protein
LHADHSDLGKSRLTVALGVLDRIDEAERALHDLLHRRPEVTQAFVSENFMMADPVVREIFLSGVKKAGLPER